jgi:hypothetical protein
MKLYVYLNIFLCFSVFASAQNQLPEITIETGTPVLSINQPFTISVIIRNSEERPQITFPDLPGLQKRSASATTAISSSGGKQTLIQTITQQYIAIREGRYEVPAATVTVNGEKIKTETFTLTITDDTIDGLTAGADPEAGSELLPDELLAQGDVFLAVQVTRQNVFVREGFAMRLSLYVSESAPVEMEFYRVDAQLQAIVRKLRPAHCWEENVGLEEIVQNKVLIKGKKYSEYRLYQSVLFPLTNQDVTFPSVNLEMLTYDTRSKDERTRLIRKFESRPVRVRVRELPEHPLKDKVPVGVYTLDEQLTKRTLVSGESFRYQFKIAGVGSLAAVMPPEVLSSASFDFYPPEISQMIRRSYDQVSGEKSFDYLVVARQNGTFPLERYFQWVYFDPRRARYDTLRAAQAVKVVGESRSFGEVPREGDLLLYENLARLDTAEPYIDYRGLTRSLINAVIILLLIGTIWIFRK